MGDLHAHLLALPFFLSAILLLWQYFQSSKPNLWLLASLALNIAISGLINLWDLVTLLCLLFLVWLTRIYRLHRAGDLKKEALAHIPSILAIFGVTGILVWPSWRFFESPVLGLGFIPVYVQRYGLSDVQWPTPGLALLGMWGAFFSAIFLGVYEKFKRLKDYLFPLALSVLSLGIILGVEIFFVRDIYSVANPPYFRANTTFKFGYHAWVLLCLASVGIIMPIVKDKSIRRYKLPDKIKIWLLVGMLFFGAFYPYQALRQFYFTPEAVSLSLNGAKWMEQQMPDDYRVVSYINRNFKRRQVIAEAVGDSYSTYARIATYTGMIAPMGWTTHEWTWRLDAQAARQAKPNQEVETGWGKINQVKIDIEQLYNTTSETEAALLIKKYNISYVYVGQLEKEKYPNLFENKFRVLGMSVFSSGSSTLYQIGLGSK